MSVIKWEGLWIDISDSKWCGHSIFDDDEVGILTINELWHYMTSKRDCCTRSTFNWSRNQFFVRRRHCVQFVPLVPDLVWQPGNPTFTNGLPVDSLRGSRCASHFATNIIAIASMLIQKVESCILNLVMDCFHHCAQPATSTVSEKVGLPRGSDPQKNP